MLFVVQRGINSEKKYENNLASGYYRQREEKLHLYIFAFDGTFLYVMRKVELGDFVRLSRGA